MLDGFLHKRFLAEMNMESVLYVMIMVIVSLFAIIFYLFLPKFLSPILVLIALLFTVFLSRYLYFHFGIVADTLPLLLAG